MLNELRRVLNSGASRGADLGSPEMLGELLDALLRTGHLAEWLAEARSNPEASTTLGQHGRETSTHYVWPLVADPETGLKLHVNQYKGHAEMGAGYAQSIHDHRYSFASMILAGGYRESRYECEGHLAGTFAMAQSGDVSFVAGAMNLVDHTAYHSVGDILPGTFTLLLKAPAAKAASTSVREIDGVWRSRRHVPVEGLAAPALSAIAGHVSHHPHVPSRPGGHLAASTSGSAGVPAGEESREPTG